MTVREILAQIEKALVDSGGGLVHVGGPDLLSLRDDLRELSDLRGLFDSAALSPVKLRTADELNPPKLLVLPSGRPFRLDLLFEFVEADRGGAFCPTEYPWMARFNLYAATGQFHPCAFYDATDAAAIRSAILRYGIEANAPTIKGEDADGDGKAG